MPRCIGCGAHFELPPVDHETYDGETALCPERCLGADIEAELARLDREEAQETFAVDSAILALYMPDQ
jgi:hypothetical protein